MKKVIAVDIDDVIVSESRSIIEYSNKHWGHNLDFDDYDENWQAMWGVDHDELLARAAELHRPGMQTSYPLKHGSKKSLTQLKKKYKLVALTSRRKVVQEETVEWINQILPGVFEKIYFTGFWDTGKPGGHLLTKGDLAKDLKVDYLIDDQPKHCISADELGIRSILFGDHRVQREFCGSKTIVLCKNWQAVLEFFDAQS